MSLDVSLMVTQPVEIYTNNITHNLGSMAAAAGIYQHLWRPEELNIKTAQELIEPLSQGLSRLLFAPEHYQQYNAANGWGTYDNLVEFIKQYLQACRDNPDAGIDVSR